MEPIELFLIAYILVGVITVIMWCRRIGVLTLETFFITLVFAPVFFLDELKERSEMVLWKKKD